jgi:hypothetical protein
VRTSTASFTVDVVNTPPVVYGTAGTTTTPQTVPVYISASASDPNSQVDCSALTWSIRLRTPSSPQPVCGCVPGQGHLQCEGDTTRDVARSRRPGCCESSSRLHVEVTDPPANPPPTIVKTLSVMGANPVGYAVREIPENGQAYGPISFSLLATDPDGVTYTFTAECSTARTPR